MTARLRCAVPVRDVVLSGQEHRLQTARRSVPAAQNAVQVTLERDYFQLEAIVVTGQATGVETEESGQRGGVGDRRPIDQDTDGDSGDSRSRARSPAPRSPTTQARPAAVCGFRLRGVGSIIGAITPLYVVDGVIVSDAVINGGTNSVTRADGPAGIAGRPG